MNTTVKFFARNSLGCDCEENVFNTINIEDNIVIDNDITIRKRIDIGNRLLVYITEPIPDGDLQKDLSAIIAKGKNERDTMGFNRLRVVIPDSLQIYTLEDAENILHGFDGFDEKLHVHIIPQNELSSLI